MKRLILPLLLASGSVVNAQHDLIPGKDIIEPQYVRPDSYKMKWLMNRDTSSFEIGEVITEVMFNKKELTIITKVNMKGAKQPWIDSTIADIKTFKPIYHSSYNGQRDMALHFGKIVTGYYLDKAGNKMTDIKDTTNTGYFDSNFYPILLRWLPLAEGYTRNLAIFDHNPAGKTGVLRASVKQVISGTIKTSSGSHSVWIVTVTDELGGADTSQVYYIDKIDRRLWKQTINAGARKMSMILVE